jgi:restriction system protein
MIGLRKWMGEGLAYQIEKQNREVEKKLLTHVQSLSAVAFERLVGRLLGEMGFEEVAVTSYSGDNGIDIRGTLVVGDVIRTKMAVQAKKWKHNVHSPVVQQVRGSLGAHEQGMIITTSDFSKGAQEEAERSDAIPVALVNGKQLVDLLIEHEVLVKRVAYELINLDVEENENPK